MNLLTYLNDDHHLPQHLHIPNYVADDLDIIPGPKIYIYFIIYISLSLAHLHDLRLLDLNLLAHLFPDNVPHLTIPKPDGILHLNVADPFAETEPDTKTKIIPSTITFPGPGGTKISWGIH